MVSPSWRHQKIEHIAEKPYLEGTGSAVASEQARDGAKALVRAFLPVA